MTRMQEYVSEESVNEQYIELSRAIADETGLLYKGQKVILPISSRTDIAKFFSIQIVLLWNDLNYTVKNGV